MTEKQKAYLALHGCVVIWGFTAILGKLISLNTLPLVWWRVVICCLVLLFLVNWTSMRQIPRSLVLRLFGIGAMVGIHWMCFYGAIKLSNASVAVATMACTSFFAALVEPVILRTGFKWYELALGIFILPGMALIAGDLQVAHREGFIVGILGAMLAAIFSCLNKKIIDTGHPPPPLAMSLIELSGATAVTSLGLFFTFSGINSMVPVDYDWIWLLVLSVVCTLLPYYLTLLAMKHISAFATNLTINLEPVYGVALAALIFRENIELSPYFYVGVGIVLLAVFSHPFLKMWIERKRDSSL